MSCLTSEDERVRGHGRCSHDRWGVYAGDRSPGELRGAGVGAEVADHQVVHRGAAGLRLRLPRPLVILLLDSGHR